MKVRADILKAYRDVHIWTGVITGIVLFIGFYAGSLSMFKHVIDDWITPPHQIMTSIETEKLDDLIHKTLTEHESANKEFAVYLDSKHQSPIVWHEKPVGRGLNLDTKEVHGSLDENGELVTQEVMPSALAELIDMLHRTAGIPGTIGHEHLGVVILGVASVLYFLALVSGVILLLPSLVKTFFALRDKKSKLRFWLDSHNIVGITSLPFHIIISLTVIVFAFHDVFYDSLKAAVYGDQEMFGRPSIEQGVNYTKDDLLGVEQLIERAKDIAPTYKVTEMNFMNLNTPRAMVRLSILDDDKMMRGPITDYIFMQPYSGEMVNSTLNKGEGGFWGGLVSTFFALHFGSFGGDMIRWVYFFLGISGAFLFYSGNLIWLEKRRQKKQKNKPQKAQRRSSLFMAALTVGTCLGSIAAVALTMVTAKWLYPWVDNINSYHFIVYYLAFLALVTFALIRGAAKSSVLLLQICAWSCLLLPITSLIAFLVPDLQIWVPNSLGTFAVDITAFFSALVFYYFSKRTSRRVKNGDKDSVWSVHNAEEIQNGSELPDSKI
jgi:uncharacterized iron-regulated membrane protein